MVGASIAQLKRLLAELIETKYVSVERKQRYYLLLVGLGTPNGNRQHGHPLF